MDNNFYNVNGQPPMNLPNMPIPQKEKKVVEPVSTVDLVFAIFALLFGFLFVKNAISSALGAGMTAYVALFVAASLTYAKAKNVKLGFTAWFGGGILILFSTVFVLSDNMFLKGWNLVFICLVFIYWQYCILNCRESKKIDAMFFFDMLKAVIILPFSNFGKLIWAISSGIRENRGSKRIIYIILGLLVAVVPSALVLSLLLSADAAFSKLMSLLFADIGDIIDLNVFPLFLGIPVALYFFGLFFSFSEKKYSAKLNRENNEKLIRSCHSISNVIICSALTPLLLIYLLFFIAQAGYLFNGFLGIVPDGLNVTEYSGLNCAV